MFVERVGPLVHRMPGDGRDGTALLGQHGRDLDIVHRDLAQHRLLGTIGLGAERGAFEKRAVQIGQCLGKTAADCGRREKRAVAAATTGDDVGALVEQADVGVDAGHRDDPVGPLERGDIEGWPLIESGDRIAGSDAAVQNVPGDFGIEVAHAELLQAAFAGKFLNDSDEQIDPAVGAGIARRADDHRHVEAARRGQHRLEIVSLPLQRAR